MDKKCKNMLQDFINKNAVANIDTIEIRFNENNKIYLKQSKIRPNIFYVSKTKKHSANNVDYVNLDSDSDSSGEFDDDEYFFSKENCYDPHWFEWILFFLYVILCFFVVFIYKINN